jgi:ribonuclease HI
MDEHIWKVTIEGFRAFLSLQATKGVRPTQMRQLLLSWVLPIIDYAASTWFGPGKRGTVRLCHALGKVQRLGDRAILRAWKAVALPILEAEANVETTRVRLTRKVVAHATKLLALPIDNPVRKALVYAKGVQRHLSPLDATIAAVTGRLKNTTTRPLLGNPPWIHAPWAGLSRRVGIVERDQAIQDANRIARAGIASLYPDASVTTRLAAIAVARRNKEGAVVVLQESIGWEPTCSALTTEIAAIAAALDYAQESFDQEPPKYPFEAPRLRVTILSDSQYALKAIRAGNGARAERASSPKDSRVFLRPRRARDRCRIQMGARTCRGLREHGGRQSSSRGCKPGQHTNRTTS